MTRAIGCYSEHTAEYLLVPKIVSILRDAFSCAVPFYFWTTREGTSLSRLMSPTLPVRLVAVFPRRPKLEAPEAESFLVRLNAELYDHANVADSFGIPVIAGVPLARSLFELGGEPRCAWFAITPQKGEHVGAIVKLDEDGQLLPSETPDNSTVNLLSEEHIRELVLQSAKPMSWEDGIYAIRKSRRGQMTWHHPFWAGSRKPLHIACIDPLNP